MSKIYARSYLLTNQLDKDELRMSIKNIPARVRYLTKTKEYSFKCFDVTSYFRYGDIDTITFKIKEEFISRFFRLDSVLEAEAVQDFSYRELKKMETDGIDDIYDDVYQNICFIQFYYYFTKEILKKKVFILYM